MLDRVEEQRKKLREEKGGQVKEKTDAEVKAEAYALLNSGKKGHPKEICGFCWDTFRSRKQRNQHTNRCKK